MLSEVLAAPLYQGIASIYDVALQHKKVKPQECELRVFRDLLKSIVPNWSDQILTKEVDRIREVTRLGGDLDKLYKAVLKAETTRLSGHFDTNSADFSRFIHQCYIHSARTFWSAPFLFQSVKDYETGYNRTKEAISIIKQSIENAIRQSLPLKSILNAYLKEDLSVIPLLDDKGKNQIDRVFSTYNIKETTPQLVASGPNPTPDILQDKVVSHHTITNFLMNDPNLIKSESVPQSPMEEDL